MSGCKNVSRQTARQHLCRWDFWPGREKMSWPSNPDRRSIKVIENDTTRSSIYDFLLTFHSNHRRISHRFRDKRRFKSKIAIFPTLEYFVPTLTGFPLELGIGAGGQKKTGGWGYQTVEKKTQDRFSRLDTNTGVWHPLQPSGHVATAIAALCFTCVALLKGIALCKPTHAMLTHDKNRR